MRRPAGRLALPADPSRHLGLGQSDGSDLDGPRRRRAPDQSSRADHEAGLGVYVRPRHGRAGLADRGAAGADLGRAGRTDGADAAVSDEAARVRPARARRGRSHRLHAGVARRGDRGHESFPPGTDLHAAVVGERRRRHARHADVAARDWRGELGRRRVRSGDERALRRLVHESVRRGAGTAARRIRYPLHLGRRRGSFRGSRGCRS